MKHPNEEAIFRAHLQDLVDTFNGDIEAMTNATVSLLLTILMEAYEQDTEDVLKAVRRLSRNIEAGFDNGELMAQEQVH